MARIGLVLGAGGIVGHAFHAGVLSALAEATRWDPSNAEIIVGTSAGSRVGALLRAGVSASDLAAFATGEAPSDDGARFLARLGPPAKLPPFTLANLFGDFPAASSPKLLLRAALRPWEARFGAVLAAALPAGRHSTEEMVAGLRRAVGEEWPDRPLWICAVKLDDGRRVTFGKEESPPATMRRSRRRAVAPGDSPSGATASRPCVPILRSGRRSTGRFRDPAESRPCERSHRGRGERLRECAGASDAQGSSRRR